MIHSSYLPTFPVLTAIREEALRSPDSPTNLQNSTTPLTLVQLWTIVFHIASQILSANHSVRSRSSKRMIIGGGELHSKPVGLVVDDDLSTTLGMLGIWLAGGVVVPLKIEPDSSADVSHRLIEAGVDVLCASGAQGISQGKLNGEGMRKAGRDVEVVKMELDLPKDDEPKSYETQPPIWMVEQWEKNAPREDPARQALMIMDETSPSRVSHKDLMDLLRRETDISLIVEPLKNLRRLITLSGRGRREEL